MPRATNAPASRERRKRRLNAAKGFHGSRSKLFRQATEAVDRAMVMATKDRRKRKIDYRQLWIMRLTSACAKLGMRYSRFIEGLTKASVKLNRKMLSEISIHDPQGFASLVELAKSKIA